MPENNNPSISTSTLSTLYSEFDTKEIEKFFATSIEDEEDVVESSTSLYTREDTVAAKLLKNVSLHILNECICQLSMLLEGAKSRVSNVKVGPLVYHSVERRFGENSNHYQSHVIGHVYTDMHRILKVGGQTLHILKEMYDEVSIFTGIACFHNFSDAYYRMKTEEDGLMKQCEEKVRTVQYLHQELANLRYGTKEMMKELDVEIKKMDGKLKDCSEYEWASARYTKQWQMARWAQNTLILRKKEKKYNDVIDGLDVKVKLENNVHDSIEKYLEESKEEYVADIERWMETYDKEIERRDIEIFAIKHRINKVQEEREELEKLYFKREKEMNDFREYKRVKKEKEDRERLENQAATRIQAWWRGTMFRKKLGPYRIKKKGKKGEKDKKKKKNKK